jgi:Ca2+-binding RTX toxin-like protein
MRDSRRNLVRLGIVMCLVGALVAPATATATPRYVTPGGATSGDCTPPPTPDFWATCAFEYAVESVSVDGDEVIVAPGDYPLTGVVFESHSVDIHGTQGQDRPRLMFSSGGNLRFVDNDARARRLEIHGELRLDGGRNLGEDLIVRGTSRGVSTKFATDTIVRDSVITASDPNGAAVFANEHGTPQLRNVTAIATGENSAGVAVSATPNDTSLTAKNVIARGGASDLSVTDCNGCGDQATLTVSHSNYRAGKVSGDGTFRDQGGNQTDTEPVFANAAGGDYHQLPTSPTIDAGTADGLIGSFDIDGEARILGSAPDIGADESALRDRDADGVLDPSDNCVATPNPDQADHEADGQGDPCDSDDDNDGVADEFDSCPADPSPDRRDSDGDGLDNPCDPDDDNDGVPDEADAFPLDPVRSALAAGESATDGDDLLNGTPGDDLICGLLGNDTINGLAGNDTLWGDACGKLAKAETAQAPTDGNDTISGGAGNDALYGAGGNDSLTGGKGNDRLLGGAGSDRLDGGKGRDGLVGGRGNDSLAARDRKRETVNCGSGRRDSATVDRMDRVRGCERVKRPKR